MNAGDILITLIKVASIPLLVLLNGFFVAAEFALVKIRDTQLDPLVGKGDRGAKVARRIVHNLDAALSATQLGITLASLALGWVGKPVFAALLAPVLKYFHVDPAQADWLAFAVGFSVITFLHIVVGELAPKSLAIQKPLAVSLRVAKPLLGFYKVFYPVIWLLNHAAFWLLRRCGLQPVNESELVHSEEEIRVILGQSRQHANGPTLEQDIALNAFGLRHRRVREVMQPRGQIVSLNAESPIAECLALAQQTRYSRFPLCDDGDIDKAIGVVHAKDIVAMQHRARFGRDLAIAARKIIFVPETARLEKLLKLFLERRRHIALVVDEYGDTVGLVTLENVLEELVGPIEDEFDDEAPLIRQTEQNSWEVSGSLPAHKINELIGDQLPGQAEVSTVSGLVTQRLGRFPRAGDAVQLRDWKLYVQETDQARVVRLRLTRRAEGENNRPPKSQAQPISQAA